MNNPNYYAIIPANVRYNKELSYLEKFLYCECTALSNVQGYCNAGNEYFAKLYDKDKATISRAISKLQELCFIHIEYERSGARVTKRKIYPLDIKTANDKIVNGTETTNDKNITREQEKLLLAIDKIVKENNVNYNYIINNVIKMFATEKEKSIISSFNFSEKVVNSILDWLLYKKEKNQLYKEKGLIALCNKLEQMIKDNNDDYLINAINYSMSQNYSGIFAENKNLNEKPVVKKSEKYTKDQLDTFFTDLDSVVL